jgi:hypothetical protein
MSYKVSYKPINEDGYQLQRIIGPDVYTLLGTHVIFCEFNDG